MTCTAGHEDQTGAAVGSANEAKPEVLVFGGTLEGRRVAEWLGGRGTCRVLYSALTDYGGSLVQDAPNVSSMAGPMLPDRMEELMRDRAFACVIDATHPYAVGISGSIKATTQATGTRLLRVLREGEPEGPWVGVGSAREAAEYVAETAGRVLLTTGSKELSVYAQVIPDFTERVFARILPVASSLAAASELGLAASHVIAMQGPFSRQFNVALMRELDVSVMVTKASGSAGGFWEKVDAARECGVQVVVIHRPLDEEGIGTEELFGILEEDLSL